MVRDDTYASAADRFDFREDGEDWCVFDTRSNSVVSLLGRDQTGLCLNAADELAAALNRAVALRADAAVGAVAS